MYYVCMMSINDDDLFYVSMNHVGINNVIITVFIILSLLNYYCYYDGGMGEWREG